MASAYAQQSQLSSKQGAEQILVTAEFKTALATAAKVYNWTPAETSLVEKALRERNFTSEEITQLQNALLENKLTSEFFANRPNPVRKSTVRSGKFGGGANLGQVDPKLVGSSFYIDVVIHYECSIM